MPLVDSQTNDELIALYGHMSKIIIFEGSTVK